MAMMTPLIREMTAPIAALAMAQVDSTSSTSAKRKREEEEEEERRGKTCNVGYSESPCQG